MTTQAERRRTHRVRPAAEIRMLLPGLATPASVRDVSASGVRCTTERPIPVLSQVHLRLLIPAGAATRELNCNGAVVRCVRNGAARQPTESFDTAIFFTDLRETDRAALEDYVARARSDGSS